MITARPAASAPVTVSQLTGRIRSVLETDFSEVVVEGEISTFKAHSSGHRYFTLKDEGAALSCTMWKSRRLAFTPQDGMKVIARGSISVYAPRGSYQLDVRDLQPLGEGELQMAFERLKRRLAEEGLFDAMHKRSLPEHPARIGVVTSKTGAALQDIIATVRRRNPTVEIIHRPTLVQGAGAAEDIASAIAEFNACGGVDVLIVGRGGGSIEDLWAFNEEVVARAIYTSSIPIVSAVGHEIDFTIADFVADARAATPTAAAEMLVPSRADLITLLRSKCVFLGAVMRRRLEAERRTVQVAVTQRALHVPERLMRQHTQTLDATLRRVTTGLAHTAELRRHRLDNALGRLQALDPRAVLARGFAIVRTGSAVVGSASAAAPSTDVTIEWADGARDARIL